MIFLICILGLYVLIAVAFGLSPVAGILVTIPVVVSAVLTIVAVVKHWRRD